jgi:hypothetical protein
MQKTEVISWDWKDSLSVVQLQKALLKMGASLYVQEVDTGGDEYAIVLSDSPITKEEADVVYEKHCLE